MEIQVMLKEFKTNNFYQFCLQKKYDFYVESVITFNYQLRIQGYAIR